MNAIHQNYVFKRNYNYFNFKMAVQKFSRNIAGISNDCFIVSIE